jgi:hypothetical protein
MSEKPILFSAPMVRAILAGSKTQTRRIITPRSSEGLQEGDIIVRWPADEFFGQCAFFRPPIKVGDTLWVREAWYCDDYRVQRGPYLKPDDMDLDQARKDGTLVYAADGLRPYEQEQPIWKPSIHMPRWASRISLRVTQVRIERLQDISEADAIAEGIDDRDVICGFSELWDIINGPDAWDSNPWVVAYSFERVTP